MLPEVDFSDFLVDWVLRVPRFQPKEGNPIGASIQCHVAALDSGCKRLVAWRRIDGTINSKAWQERKERLGFGEVCSLVHPSLAMPAGHFFGQMHRAAVKKSWAILDSCVSFGWHVLLNLSYWESSRHEPCHAQTHMTDTRKSGATFSPCQAGLKKSCTP